ncbi:ligase-associated DNA damage response endonuclease PdeM [Patiriisocius sp. Uisw_017]|uniref:ligase-associated DNA damage response endonuclease PdeM n=1 Tax=Patiriisocius sp. Uisw_017 TaxID=3230968 RepID=UPI0039ED387B
MTYSIKIKEEDFILHPSGALFWKQKAMLLLADVHLGKVTHFRKHGAAVPAHVAYENLEKLTEVVNHFQPETVCFLGDLFHSTINSEWQDFVKWVAYTPSKVVLISGNHDIIPKYLFEDINVEVLEEQIIDGFYLTHHPTEHKTLFNFCGHIHPGVKMKGIGRQIMKLACFFKTKNQLIFPAFGSFTGNYILEPTKDDEVFVIAEGEVVCVS